MLTMQHPALRPEESEYGQVEQTILIGLRVLAGQCDGAQSWDGLGFNKPDSFFGKSLAEQKYRLTPRQLSAAFFKLVKYQGQLSNASITLPSVDEVREYVNQRETAYAGEQTKRNAERAESNRVASLPRTAIAGIIDYVDGKLIVTFDYNREGVDKMQVIKGKISSLRLKDVSISPVFFDYAKKMWVCPTQALTFLQESFPLFVLSDALQAEIARQEENARAAREAADALERAADERTHRALALLNDLEGVQGVLDGREIRLYQHQKDVIKRMVFRRRFINAHDMGMGKAEPLDAKVLTPTGWTRMGDIQVGDRVIASDGKPTHVAGVYPQGEKDIYRVLFSDGSSVECCDEHLWAVNTPVRKRRGNPYQVKMLAEIRNDLRDAAGNCKHYIPMVQPVEFEEQELPLDPYLLGALIGDGSLTARAVSIASADQELLDAISNVLPEGVTLQYRSQYDWALTTGNNGKKFNPVLNALRALSLHGHTAYTKFIPDRYKFASVSSRIALLQGLLDTDGSVSNGNSNIEFSTSSAQLALDVVELVQSLGGVAYTATRVPSYTYKDEKKDGATSYRINICLPSTIVPFRLQRKAEKYQPRSKYQPTRAIVHVEYVGRKEAQCIAVFAPDHLYVTDDYIVTHNTFSTLIAAKAIKLYEKKYNAKQVYVFVIGPVSTREDWLRSAGAVGMQIAYYTWGSIPKQPGVSYILIADEAQNAQTYTAQRTKKFLALAEDAEACFMLSGTPMKNGRPANLYPLLVAAQHPVAYPPDLRKTAFEKEYCAAQVTRWSKWDITGATNLSRLNQLLLHGKAACLEYKRKQDCLDLPPKERILKEVEITREARGIYERTVEGLWERYEANVARRLADYIEEKAQELQCDPREVDTWAEENRIRQGEALVALGVLRHAGSVAKVENAIEMALEVIEQGDAPIIFTAFKDSAEAIARVIHASVNDLPPAQVAGTPLKDLDIKIISGDLVGKHRAAALEEFQKSDAPAIVCLYGAGGVGVNLQRSANVILVDRPWTPGDAFQAEDRAWRIGQNRKVTAYWLQLPTTLTPVDVKVDAVLHSKQRNIDNTLMGEEEIEGITFLGDKAESLLAEALGKKL